MVEFNKNICSPPWRPPVLMRFVFFSLSHSRLCLVLRGALTSKDQHNESINTYTYKRAHLLPSMIPQTPPITPATPSHAHTYYASLCYF